MRPRDSVVPDVVPAAVVCVTTTLLADAAVPAVTAQRGTGRPCNPGSSRNDPNPVMKYCCTELKMFCVIQYSTAPAAKFQAVHFRHLPIRDQDFGTLSLDDGNSLDAICRDD